MELISSIYPENFQALGDITMEKDLNQLSK